MPGEWYSPTQPFVTKPPAFDRQGVQSMDDLIDFTPELNAEASSGSPRTTRSDRSSRRRRQHVAGPLGTLMSPSATGGANWQGGSLDPETNTSTSSRTRRQLARHGQARPDAVGHGLRSCAARLRDPNAATSRAGAARGRGAAAAAAVKAVAGGLTVQGLPLVKPPYATHHRDRHEQGRRSVWQIAHGETPDNIKNNPALKGLTIPRTGRQGRIGVLDDQDAGDRRRRRILHDAQRPARRDAARLRQGDRARKSAPSTCRRRRPVRR